MFLKVIVKHNTQIKLSDLKQLLNTATTFKTRDLLRKIRLITTQNLVIPENYYETNMNNVTSKKLQLVILGMVSKSTYLPMYIVFESHNFPLENCFIKNKQVFMFSSSKYYVTPCFVIGYAFTWTTTTDYCSNNFYFQSETFQINS